MSSNTATLQERFPETYTEFFAKSNIALSASASFYWMGELAVLFGGPAIMQKLPLKSYAGLEFTDQSGVEIGNRYAYHPYLQQFSQIGWPAYEGERVIKFIKEEFATRKNKLSAGFRLHAINEAPPGEGLNSSGAFAVSLAAALHLWTREISSQDLLKWKQCQTTNKLMQDKLFRKVVATAWKIENILHSDAASGAGWAAAAVYSNYPVFFMTEYRIGDWEDHGQARFPVNPAGQTNIFDTMKFVVHRLDELFPIKEHFGFPVDYGLISTGRHRDIVTLKAVNKINTALIKKLTRLAKEDVAPHLKKLKGCSPIAQMLSEEGWESLWQASITGPLSALTLHLFFIFQQFYNDDYSELAIESFMHLVRSYDMWLYVLGTTGREIRPIMRFFRDTVNKDPDAPYCGTKVTGAGKVGGDFLFVVPVGSIREHTEERIASLRKQFDNDMIMLDYANWLDGYGTEGLKVEQSLPEETYSSFVSPGSIQIIQFSPNGQTKHFLIKGSEYKQLISQSELTIDMIDEKIFIAGKAPTSKELPSASATAQVLSRLLQSPDCFIKNSALPRSSYASNRNDLQSKILTPLNKLLQKHLNKTLPIELHGSYSDFHLRLVPPVNIQIIIAKRVL